MASKSVFLLAIARVSFADETHATAATTAHFTLSTHGISFQTPAGVWAQPLPLELQTVARDGSVAWTRGAYAAVSADGSSANGTLTSPGGCDAFFSDALSCVTADGFTLTRVVTILSIGAEETAFASQFSLPAPAGLAAARRELSLPGLVYQNLSALPRGALAGDPRAAHILVREDRLPLPFALSYFPADNGSGAARLVHMSPDGRTLPDEDLTARIVDERLRFGSIGFINSGDGSFSLAFQFPGSEGDRTYVYDASGGGWANRSHPLVLGFSHTYTLAFTWQDAASSYYRAAERAWREVFDAFAPPTPPSPLPSQLYRDGMELLAAYGVAHHGVAIMPFEASLPDGHVIDSSSQMGFVGRALPCAALLLYDALVSAPNSTRVAQAEAIIDVWVSHAGMQCGVVKTWYDLAPSGAITWRGGGTDAYQGSIRIMTDGMMGLLDAFTTFPSRTDWLAAALRYADFLVSHLAADGSIASSFGWSCEVLSSDTRQTHHIIPFLVSCFNATHDNKYRAAALAAGAFSAASFEGVFSYEGGAVDNHDVADKEAGWLAAQAFIALYELTGDAAWLAPAAQAATYAETFTYAWDVPLACAQVPPTVYPCHRTTLGSSLIATGQSGVDNYMAIASHDFSRLGVWLGDAHFVRFGAWLGAATSQVTDWDGSLGYAHRGLMHEAATLSVRRGAGVADWLPWLTANLLHPLVQAQRAGGGG